MVHHFAVLGVLSCKECNKISQPEVQRRLIRLVSQYGMGMHWNFLREVRFENV